MSTDLARVVHEPAPVRRIFYAHRRAVPDADVDAQCTRLSLLLKAQNPAAVVTVVAGRDDFKARGRTTGGGFDGWALSCSGVVMGEPRFHAFIVPDERVGKATAVMLTEAITRGRRVAWWDGAEKFVTIKHVVVVAPNDWKTGWAVRA